MQTISNYSSDIKNKIDLKEVLRKTYNYVLFSALISLTFAYVGLHGEVLYSKIFYENDLPFRSQT